MLPVVPSRIRHVPISLTPTIACSNHRLLQPSLAAGLSNGIQHVLYLHDFSTEPIFIHQASSLAPSQ